MESPEFIVTFNLKVKSAWLFHEVRNNPILAPTDTLITNMVAEAHTIPFSTLRHQKREPDEMSRPKHR